MQYVWVLVIYMSSGGHNGGPTVIDNIATQEECVRVSQVVAQSNRVDSLKCIQVRKLRN